MAKLSTDLRTGTLHPRENLSATGTLGSINAELIISGDGVSVVSLDLRGTFSLTAELSGTVNGTDWSLIPVRPQNSPVYVTGVVGTAPGVWRGEAAGYRQIRVRVTAYTSGAATATLLGSTAPMPTEAILQGQVNTLAVTVTAAVNTLTTLTLPAPGAGLRQYVDHIQVTRFATALLTANAAPIVAATTNLPGTPTLTLPQEAFAQGAASVHELRWMRPLAASAQNTAVTLPIAATPNVIWRINAAYYVAP